MEVIGHEARVVGRVLIGGTYRVSYSTFRRCIFLGSLTIDGPGNQLIDCTVIASEGRHVDCTPELRGRRN